MKIKVKRLHPDAIIPTRAHEGDAGVDLYALEDFNLHSLNTRAMVRTGIAIEIPHGYVGLVHPRSGLSKYGISIVNTPGTIDAGYRGELLVHLIGHEWHDKVSYTGKQGDRIAQLLIQKVELPEYVEVEELSDSVRGDRGWGSSGN